MPRVVILSAVRTPLCVGVGQGQAALFEGEA